MDMEATEELVGSTLVAKGKRTKRHRPFSSTLANSSSSSASADDPVSFNSSTTTTYDSTQEEQDMANCLILLAQGVGDAPPPPPPNNQHQPEPTTAKFNNALDLYECKTCNRAFPSFQALGGHRASHKKPKLEDKKPQHPPPQPSSPSPPPQVASFGFEDAVAAEPQFKFTSPISLQLPSPNKASPSPTPTNKAKIHECSICGSEFTSGQALGGHMRRHRASTTTNTAVEVKPRTVLELDLNLPAPEDDLRDSKFQFPPTHKSLVLSAPALVDCHY